MKRFVACLVALLMIGTLVSGCASQNSAPQGGAEGNVTIRMIESLTSPERTAVLRTIADKFEAEHEGVTVEIISPPLEGADQKIAQMLMAKQPLDVVEVREQTAAQFINNQWLAPLDSYVENWDGKDTLTPAAQTALSQIGDKMYLMPYGFYQRLLFYRADWFEEAGLEAPKTWEDIYNAGVALTDPAQNRYGWSFRGGNGGVNMVDMLYWAYLGADRLADPTASYFLAGTNGETIFSTPEAKEALEFNKKLYQDASPRDAIAWGFSEMVQGFIGGTTAMIIQDPEVIPTCQQNMEEDQWAVQVLPVGPSGQAIFPNGYAGWGMTSYSENPDLAAEFILFLSNEENNTYFAKEYSTIPIHTTAPELDSFFVEGPFSVFVEMGQHPDVFCFGAAPQSYEAFGEYFATIDQEYQKYYNGQITADELLAYLDQYWSKAYQEEGQRW